MKNLLIIFLFVSCFTLSAQQVDENNSKIEKGQNTLLQEQQRDKKSSNTKKRSKATRLNDKEEQDLQKLHEKRLKKNKGLKEKSLSKKGKQKNVKVYDKKDPSGL
ncbi:hypothetical protein [Aquimarina sp. Aq107]|uniref:hypothetical protein n=1 Tax=Aquimarina sp. Aq107 TaxID=1191912 RepID=UPI000D54C09E|nr:hypothetical protein [Aquimarina sp. Aq107]